MDAEAILIAERLDPKPLIRSKGSGVKGAGAWVLIHDAYQGRFGACSARGDM